MNNLRANLKYHEDCGVLGCESVGYYIPYEEVKKVLNKYLEIGKND